MGGGPKRLYEWEDSSLRERYLTLEYYDESLRGLDEAERIISADITRVVIHTREHISRTETRMRAMCSY